jgi:peptide/nickel transport system permease protein
MTAMAPLPRPGLRPVRRNPLTAVGAGIVGVSILLALFGGVVAPYDPEVPSGRVSVPPPSLPQVPGLLLASVRGQLDQPVHWFGTDSAGLDVFSRVVCAPRVDVVVGLAATGLSLLLGTFLGLLAGYYRTGGSEAFILAMILVVLTGRSLLNIVLALAVLFTPIFLRLTRSQVVTQRSRTYVEAARAVGHREIVIALKHVLRNSMSPSLIQASVTVGWAILLTAGLSFVGAGVRPPTPEWGGMIATGASLIVLGEWWPSVFPGIAISLTVFGYAVLGNLLEERYGRSS